MSKNSKMTIEKLATMVAKGFNGIDGKMATKNDIKELKLDLESVERRLSTKIESIDEKVEALEEVDVRNLQQRVYILEKDVKQIKQKHV